MTDYILDISFDARDTSLEERIQSLLFLSASTGSSSVEVNGTITISAYFASAEDRDDVGRALSDVELHATERERVDWLALYQQSLEPIAIGTRFVVAPDASLIAGDDRLSIVVPQEQAFGTGSHETTSLCIEILETLAPGGKRGLDVGAGSGILAIAMHRLGAAKVIAFDNDPDAYGALRDNRIRNGVPPDAMPLFIGGIEALRGGRFDVITMNIIPEIILPLLSEIASRMASEAQLILSGILAVRRGDIVEIAAANHGLRLVEEREKGEWWAGVF
ncbi:MAG TPA: 50S ribosomal protein L11 methyltransferase, partial [Thermoanaerobaculia bacterium]|nr:50S ribosomal protein L11 methyltransferase [Thermoanaerobaculia bacterium]